MKKLDITPDMVSAHLGLTADALDYLLDSKLIGPTTLASINMKLRQIRENAILAATQAIREVLS